MIQNLFRGNLFSFHNSYIAKWYAVLNLQMKLVLNIGLVSFLVVLQTNLWTANCNSELANKRAPCTFQKVKIMLHAFYGTTNP